MLCHRCGTYNPDEGAHCSACGQVLSGAKTKQAHTAPQKASPYQVGDLIGDKYKVEALIGPGPTSFVYRVSDGSETLALKVINPRFLQTPEDRGVFAKALVRSKKM